MPGQLREQICEILIELFDRHHDDWNVRALTGQRISTSDGRFRVPGICVARNRDLEEMDLNVPPLLCVEILSEEDRLQELQQRVDDYAPTGVRGIWAINPGMRIGYHASELGFKQPEDGVLRVEGTPIKVELEELFAGLRD